MDKRPLVDEDHIQQVLTSTVASLLENLVPYKCSLQLKGILGKFKCPDYLFLKALSASFRVDGASGGVDGAVFVCRNAADPRHGAANGEGVTPSHWGGVQGASPRKKKCLIWWPFRHTATDIFANVPICILCLTFC